MWSGGTISVRIACPSAVPHTLSPVTPGAVSKKVHHHHASTQCARLTNTAAVCIAHADAQGVERLLRAGVHQTIPSPRCVSISARQLRRESRPKMCDTHGRRPPGISEHHAHTACKCESPRSLVQTCETTGERFQFCCVHVAGARPHVDPSPQQTPMLLRARHDRSVGRGTEQAGITQRACVSGLVFLWRVWC